MGMTEPVRFAVRANWEEVARWFDGADHPAHVSAHPDGWALVDALVDGRELVSASSESTSPARVCAELARWSAASAFCVVDEALVRSTPDGVIDELFLDQPEPGSAGDWLPWSAYLAALAQEYDVPTELLDRDATLSPPAARQVSFVRSRGEPELVGAATGAATRLGVLDLDDGWSLIAAVSEDDDVLPATMGLGSGRRGRGLLLASGTSVGFLVLRRGEVVDAHRWNVVGRMAGVSTIDDRHRAEDLEVLLAPAFADAARVLETVTGRRPTKEDEHRASLVRALLRRSGEATELVRELIALLDLSAGELAVAALTGQTALHDLPGTRIVEPERSMRAAVQRAAQLGNDLVPERVPLADILAACAVPFIGVLWVVRLIGFVRGDLDGFGIAQLVGTTLTLPMGIWSFRRARKWRRLRQEHRATNAG